MLMKKLKLLLAACALFVGVSAGWAQTDVTATYLTNAGFDDCTAETSDVAAKTMIDYSSKGWTKTSSGDYTTIAVTAYGGGNKLATSTTPATKKDGSTVSGNTLGIIAGWQDNVKIQSGDITLPAGAYTITIDHYLSSSTSNYTSSSSQFGFVTDSKSYLVSNTTFTASTWTTETVTFTLTESTTGKIQIGLSGLNSSGSGSPAVFYDDITITWTDPDLAAAQAKLSGYIKKATALNGVLSDATLGTAITTAEGILSTATTSSACNDASENLSSTITTALSGLTPVALTNGNFDTTPNNTLNGDKTTTFGGTLSTATSNPDNTKDMSANTGDHGYLYDVTGWTQYSKFNSTASQGTTSEYGTAMPANGWSTNSTTPPATDMLGSSTGAALHLSAGWGDQARYQQTVNDLPSGRYLLYYEVINQYSNTSIASNYTGVSGASGDFYGTTNSFVYSSLNSAATGEWIAEAFEFDVAKTANINFNVGFTTSTTGSGNGAKLWIDNVLVYRIADLMVEEADANQIIEDAEALNDVAYNATQKSDLASKLSAFKSNKSLDNYSALNVSLGNAKASADHYQNDLKPIIDGLKGYATADLSAMDNDYNNGVYTNETDKAALIEQYQSIEIPALKAANATNYTSAIINPDFELDGKKVQNPTGWSHTNHGSDDGTRDGSVENMTGWYYNAYQSWWDSNVNIKQTITNLPNGQYTISATLAGWSGCTVNLTANDKWTYINGAGDGTGVDASVTCNVTDGQLDIMVNWGVRDGDNKGTFFKCDNFTLTYNGVKPMLAEAITEANAIYNNGANVGAGVFQIPTAAGTTFSNAISTAQGVYDNSGATASELQTAYDNLETAVTAFLETEINKPAEGQLFNVILTYKDYTYDQKAMTYLAGDRDDQGGYNIKYQAPANKNLAQAFTFTKVEGNNYKMSQIDADGNVRYMCTAKVYDEKGSTSSIRTTTNADDAMLITVIPTATEGVWNLKNVIADNFVGSQDAGVFTVNSHIDFNIVETTKPSIAINTTAAGYGTTMLPFAVASLPDDVKAYTCEEVDGTMLTLVEVTALAANKPYIIEGAWETNLSGDAQGTAVTCTEGLLTGVYAETTAPVGSYVLQNLSTGLGFYKVADGKQPTVMANHAYLTKNSSARVLFFDNATAIRAIEALTNGEAEIYNAAGARQKGLQKGVNIIKQGNKTYKVMVK